MSKKLAAQIRKEFEKEDWFQSQDEEAKSLIIESEVDQRLPVSNEIDTINSLWLRQSRLWPEWELHRAQQFPFLPPYDGDGIKDNQKVRVAKREFISELLKQGIGLRMG